METKVKNVYKKIQEEIGKFLVKQGFQYGNIGITKYMNFTFQFIPSGDTTIEIYHITFDIHEFEKIMQNQGKQTHIFIKNQMNEINKILNECVKEYSHLLDIENLIIPYEEGITHYNYCNLFIDELYKNSYWWDDDIKHDLCKEYFNCDHNKYKSLKSKILSLDTQKTNLETFYEEIRENIQNIVHKVLEEELPHTFETYKKLIGYDFTYKYDDSQEKILGMNFTEETQEIIEECFNIADMQYNCVNVPFDSYDTLFGLIETYNEY